MEAMEAVEAMGAMGETPRDGKGGRRVELSGVPETLLWNLYMRAAEARRARTVLDLALIHI
ncbi:hypothetical protein JBE27_41320, partial [Streptomyces albiflaviniger]|nr:hypothetical protein [Streptomyces albiflaviniger]